MPVYALVAENMNQPITPADAKRSLEDAGIVVSYDTIISWIRRKKIQPSGLDEHGRKMYPFVEILRAESETRHNALGRRAS